MNKMNITKLMLEKVPPTFDLLGIEKEILDYWERENIMEESFSINRGRERFSFLEGPPTANGPPHIGHAETRAMKDLFLRYKTMKGYYIYPRIAGWDCHGLPVEIEIEKKLGIKNKSEIEKMGIEKFNSLCKRSVFEYVKLWEEASKRLAYWVDYKDAYVTMKDEYIESEWWALKKLYEDGLLFKDFRVSPYCPRCGTTLSSHEVAQGYKDVEDFSIYVLFKAVEKDEYFLVWTTTPWTLPANEYLAVNPNFTYSLIMLNGKRVWVQEDRAKELFPGAEIINKRIGSQLSGIRYEQLMPYLKVKKGLYVVSADFVTKDEGSGIVHVAPAFGADDYAIMKREKGELYITVDESGKISLDCPWKGMDVQTASESIIQALKEDGKLLKTEKAVHTYPFCWRCDTRLIYYPIESWYIGVSRVKDKIVEYNKNVNWKPDYIGSGRFGNFLAEGKDWALSRNRFWGTPLPVWICKNGHVFVPGSKKELLEHASFVPKDFELHRPKVDEIVVKCDHCGENMKREPYPIDTWFDSGSAFFAQFHYPFENSQLFEENNPIDFISEAMDQTRGWFYSLHVISSLLFGRNAFRNVVVMEFILNSKGEKMSKSRGDTVNPLEIIDRIGTDSLRLFFFQGPPWKPKRFTEEGARELSWKMLGTLYNSYFLFSTNANLDKWIPAEEKLMSSLDRWLISRTNKCISLVTSHMDNYEPHLALEEIKGLILDLSQWYLRLSRDLFWENEMTLEKRSAYYASYYAIKASLALLAPFTPYFADYLFRKMTGERSVHLTRFPSAGEIDENLIKEMEVVKEIVETGRRVRQKNGLTLRRPVKEIVITDSKYSKIVEEFKDIIKKELNTKELKIGKLDNYVNERFILKKSVAGKMFGKHLKDAEGELSRPEIQESLRRNGSVTILNNTIKIEDVDVVRELRQSYVSDDASNLILLVNKETDEKLMMEGLAREIVRRIQSMRRQMNLEYTDKVIFEVSGDPLLIKAFNEYSSYVLGNTQGEVGNVEGGFESEWDISGMNMKIKMMRKS
ncbi:MAG: isoleucine--tRNA ligase [Thermoplasmatales archaeon]